MRIALVHWSALPVMGGVETHLAVYADELAKCGHEVFLYTGTRDPLPIPGVEHVYVPQISPDAHVDVYGLSGFLETSWNRRGIEVVHGHNLHMFRSQIMESVLRATNVFPGMRTVHTWHSRGIFRMETSQWQVRTAVSQSLAHVVSSYGVPVQGVPLGIALEPFTALPLAPLRERPVVLLPGRLVPEKGALVALEAVALAREWSGVDAELWLTAPMVTMDLPERLASFRQTVLDSADMLGLTDRVRLLDVAYQDMADVYSMSSVVLCPSQYDEPLGLAALEGMASGRPVIATPRGGLRQTGAWLAHDAPGFAMMLSELLRDEDRRQRVGRGLRRLAVLNFGIRAYTDKMMHLYRNWEEGS